MHHSDRTNPFVNRKPLTSGGRETFLKRVRASLGREATAMPTGMPVREESLIRQVAKNIDRAAVVERFAAKAKENTMVVHRVPPEAAAIHAALDACLANHKIAKSAVNLRELDGKFRVAEHLAAKNIAAVLWGSADSREQTFDCQASITDCRGGIADTGSIVVYSDPAFGRTTTLVVPVHIVFVPASRIMPDMIDALERVRQENPETLPSNIVFITGPSKTGDIEMKLVTGVHGPKFMYVILIDGM